jgi:hypothetical protein
MNNLTNDFINTIGRKTDQEFSISTKCERFNGVVYATLWIAQEVAKEIKESGYNALVIDNKTGEVLFIA